MSIGDYNKNLLGNAKQRFDELKFGDKLYYANPSKIGTIGGLTIKEVTRAKKPGWVIITYFKSDQAYDLIPNKEDAPTGKMVVEGSANQCFSMSLPPTMYFTNEKQARAFVYQP